MRGGVLTWALVPAPCRQRNFKAGIVNTEVALCVRAMLAMEFSTVLCTSAGKLGARDYFSSHIIKEVARVL